MDLKDSEAVQGDQRGVAVPMTSQLRGGPACQEFVREIKDLYIGCGSPPSSSVNKIAPRLGEIYPLAHGRSTLPTSVSRSMLSQVVNGERLPSAHMLTVIVLSLERCGRENESLSPDQGPQDLAHWQRLLRRAKAEAASPARQRPAPDPQAQSATSDTVPADWDQTAASRGSTPPDSTAP
ncbi:hypothetical protein, partial [Actinomadura geliboluensis]